MGVFWVGLMSPLKSAPSIDARYFCLVKHPARKKLSMGVFWVGLMSPVPAMALYTLLGVFTTWYLRILAYLLGPSSWASLALISPGKSLSSSVMVASMMSSSLLPIQSLAGAKTSSSMLLSPA